MTEKDAFLNKMSAFAAKYDMLPSGCRILAAVSGGADSMCLLDSLLALSAKGGFTVCAAHYNHRLRGAESDADEAFVRDFCLEKGIDFLAGGGDVAGAAAESGRGIEETARDMRYAFLKSAAESLGCSKIATAHSSGDNAETMLINLARGAGTKGLSGIPPVRGNIVRPILCMTRTEIEAQLKSRGVSHREDSSNAADDYTRNRLRHHVIPLLCEINPAFFSSAATAAGLLADDEAYLSSQAEAFIEKCGGRKLGRLPADALAALPLPVARRAVRLMCPKELSASHVKAVLDICTSENPSASADIPGMTVRREYGDVVFGGDVPSGFEAFTIAPGQCRIIPESGLRVICSETVCVEKVHKSLNTFLFQKASVYGKISIRPRRTGDIIRLCRSNGSKTLKKLFIERKIPASKRALVPVIADDNGPLAIYSLGADSRAAANPGDPVLKIEFEEIL